MTDLCARWRAGLPTELAFWDGWLGARGDIWGCDPAEFEARFNPLTPLQENIRALIGAPEGAIVRILDLGAGPTTVLGTQWPGRRVHIVAVDALAADYRRLMHRYALTPPVSTQAADAEDICGEGMEYLYDLAYARNALDHCYDPLRAIRGMLSIVKPGGVVYLLHHIREADTRQRQGLHRWNFYDEGPAYYLETDGQPRVELIRATAHLTRGASIHHIGNDVEVILWRKSDVQPADPRRTLNAYPRNRAGSAIC